MNNAKVLEAGTRIAARHPKRTLKVSVLAIRRRRAILMVVNGTRAAAKAGSTVKQAAGDRKVKSETSAAVSSLMLAGKRARRVGVANAPADKQVAAQLHRAGRHASKALIAARRPRHRHPVLRTTTIVTGAGAVGGAAYAGWKVYGRSALPPSPTPSEALPANESPTDDI
jgi:hypothetical protein